MNKLERVLKGRNKWVKRLKRFGYWNKGNPESFTYCFKEQTKPCSCYGCSPYKYDRKEKFKRNLKLENYMGEFHPDLINDLQNG